MKGSYAKFKSTVLTNLTAITGLPKLDCQNSVFVSNVCGSADADHLDTLNNRCDE